MQAQNGTLLCSLIPAGAPRLLSRTVFDRCDLSQNSNRGPPGLDGVLSAVLKHMSTSFHDMLHACSTSTQSFACARHVPPGSTVRLSSSTKVAIRLHYRIIALSVWATLKLPSDAIDLVRDLYTGVYESSLRLPAGVTEPVGTNQATVQSQPAPLFALFGAALAMA